LWSSRECGEDELRPRALLDSLDHQIAHHLTRDAGMGKARPSDDLTVTSRFSAITQIANHRLLHRQSHPYRYVAMRYRDVFPPRGSLLSPGADRRDVHAPP